MKENELRVGNYVNLPHGDCQILYFLKVGVHLTDGNGGTFHSLKPIPLTEEWLVKFGLNNYPNRKNFYNLGEYSILLTTETTLFYIGRNIIKIKYVHQLQNLYFALTGEELINES